MSSSFETPWIKDESGRCFFCQLAINNCIAKEERCPCQCHNDFTYDKNSRNWKTKEADG